MNPVVVGIDEAGRGAIAGPVVAGACVLDDSLYEHAFIKDSKQLTAAQREEAFQWLQAHAIYGVGIVEAEYIDENGILAATELAMQQAVADLARKVTPTYLLVDGRDKFWFDFPHSSIIKGDEKELCISAASILAKVTRDDLMIDLSKKLQLFGFENHKGYGTPEHYDALDKHGITPVHRKTFLHPTSSIDTTPVAVVE